MPYTEHSRTNRIPTLDGWRGIAIAMVLFDHIQSLLLGHYGPPWLQTGEHGVTIFFVLSGFLITSKLIEGPINLQSFYLRRFFRLMPAAWTYLAFVGILTVVTRTRFVTAEGLWSSLFFFRNYAFSAKDVTGHFWSLSLEEQFYLFWPCVLWLAGARRSRWIAGIGALGIAAYRSIFWVRYSTGPLIFVTQMHADALLVGSLLALGLADPHMSRKAEEWSKFWAFPSAVALLIGIMRFHSLTPLWESLAIAGLLAATSLHPNSALTRPFAFPPLVQLGMVSYSVYIWQQLFVVVHNLVLLCVGLPLLALASYYWMEGPSTRFGHRLTSRMSSSPAPVEAAIAD